MRKHWAKLVVILGVLLLVTILTTRHFAASPGRQMAPSPDAGAVSSQAGECAQCHEMRPEVLTWQVSVHDKFACTVCHINKTDADYAAQHKTGSFLKPIKHSDPVPNSVCLRCHSANRVVSPGGDLKIPHQTHLNAGVTCVTCHFGVAHAKVAERDLSFIMPDPANYDAWTPEIAQKVVTDYYIKPSMWTCLNCHKERNVTTKCGACHTSIPTLPSHDQPAWKSEHGKFARNNELQQCVNCHATPGLPTSVMPSTGDKAADFARSQQFCYSCHLQRPAFHGKSMITSHPGLAAELGMENCLTCHDVSKPQPGENVPKIYCNQCHWFNSKAGG